MQVLTIVASRGNVYLLASLYAFGVIWSFSFMSLAVMVLRYKSPENRQWKVPGNIRIRGVEVPVGVILISVVLFSTADREPADQATGDHRRACTFSVVFFIVFTVSERRQLRTSTPGRIRTRAVQHRHGSRT